MNAPPRAPGVRWGWLLPAYASLFLLGLNENTRGPLFPDVLSGLALSDAQGGLMFATASAGVVGGSLVGRRAVVRVGALRWQLVSLLIAALGVLATGAAPSLDVLVLGSALYGLGGGGLMVTQNLLVSAGSPPDLRRQALSGLHAMYGLASLLGPLLVAGLGRLGLGWRGCFYLLAVPTLLLGLAHLGLPADRAEERSPPGTERPGWRGQQAALIAALYVTSELLISTRLVLLLRRDGYAPDPASLGLAGFFACLLAGRVLFSVWRWPGSNRSLLGLSAAGALACNLAGLLGPPWLLIPAAFFMAPFFPVLVDLVSHEFPRAVEPVLGRVFATVSLCLVLAHWGVGALSDRLDLRTALGVGPLALLGVLLLLATLPRPPGRGYM